MDTENLLRFVLENTVGGRIEKSVGLRLLQELRGRPDSGERDIAVIGISGRFPKSPDLDAFWKNLSEGIDCIGPCPRSRIQDAEALVALHGKPGRPSIPEAGYLDEIAMFDPEFFRISPREASLMDPHQRVFLQCAHAAMENAGYGGSRLKGSDTGVFVGFSDDMRQGYAGMVAQAEPGELSFSVPGNLASIIAGRVAHHLDLRGPALVVDTACSSALVAVHLACQSLRTGECAQAIAGGVKLNLHPVDSGIRIGIESSTARTRSFDADADGTGIGEGVGALLLKPLGRAREDGDHIWAIIKGSAVNQDGASAGMTVPNLEAQSRVLQAAWKDARVNPETIGYIEAHGTGTVLGDPIEIEGIRAAFGAFTARKQFCALGTVKSNIGHLFEASGIAGLIKAILSLHARKIPPSLGFASPNRRIAFEDSPVYLNDRLQDWASEDGRPRCGVSAFGFSGTNGHMVLEAAPESAPSSRSSRPGIAVLSAKSRSALMEAAGLLLSHLQSDTNPSLDSLCFTLCVGRGHYGQRLALAAESLSALRGRLARVVSDGLGNAPSEGIWYGTHATVVSGAADAEPGSLPPEEAQAISAQAAALAERLADPSGDGTERAELCRLYVQGAAIPWELLFSPEQRRVLPLPGYPFAKRRCWVRFPVAGAEAESTARIHPLLEQSLGSQTDGESFRTDFTVEKHWVVRDHRVMGYPVVPGFAYPELAVQAAYRMGLSGPLELKAFSFYAPVILRDDIDASGIHVQATRSENGLSLAITGVDGDQARGRYHVTGEVVLLPDSECPAQIDIGGLLAAFPEDPRPADVNMLAAGFIEFGPRWTHRHRYWSSENAVLAELELDAGLSADLEEFLLHPGLLDMAVNTRTLTLGNESSQRYLPFSFGSMRVYRPLPGRFYCRIETRQDLDNGETVRFDAAIFDIQGNTVVTLRDYAIKKVRDFKWLTPLDRMFRIAWVPRPLSGSPSAPASASLVIHDGSDFGKAMFLSLAGSGGMTLESGLRDARRESGALAWSESDEGRLIWRDILRKENLDHVVFLSDPAMDADEAWVRNGAGLVRDGHAALLRLVRNLAEEPGGAKRSLSLIVKRAHAVIGGETPNPLGASLLAMGEVIEKENPGIRCLALDVDEGFGMAAWAAEIQGTGTERKIAYRGGVRFAEELAKVDHEEVPLPPFAPSAQGAIVITGGTGGLGMVVAKHLATMGARKLHLLSRNGPSDPEAGRAIQEMERAGAKVQCHRADVGDAIALAGVLEGIRASDGSISGIIHAAGAAGSGFLALKSEARFLEVLAPKIAGTLNLHALTRQDPLDFFLLFSSVASLLGLPGQGDYTSANAFLDAFAEYRMTQGLPALAIGWPAWSETGMAVRHGNARDTVFAALGNVEAMRAMSAAFRQKHARVWVGEFRPVPGFAELLRVGLGKNLPKAVAPLAAVSAPLKAVRLTGRESGSYSLMEARVAACWGDALGYDELDVRRNFYDLGGDSLMAVKVAGTLAGTLGLQVSIPDLFRFLTIPELATHLDGLAHHAGPAEKPVLERIPDAIAYPAAPAQQAVFAQEQFDGVGTAYNLPFLVPIEGEPDPARVERAFREVMLRQEALRTSFAMVDGEVVQRINQDCPCEFTVLPCADAEWSITAHSLIKPFDLGKAPLARGYLLRSRDKGSALFVDMHHIIADGVSIDIFIREFASAYAHGALAPLETRYRDYAVFQEKLAGSEYLERQRRYWKDKLADGVPEINLPWDEKRGETRSFRGGNLRFGIGKETMASISAMSKARSATLNDFLFAVSALVLHKYGEQEEVVVGTLVSGRNDPALRETMGMFNNYLPVRCAIDSGATFNDHLESVKGALQGAFGNQDFPYSRMVGEFHRRVDLSRNPFFDVMLIFHGQFDPTRFTPAGDLALGPFRLMNESHAKLDMRMDVISDGQGGLSVFLEYNAALFRHRTMEDFSLRFGALLERVLAGPETRIGDLELATKTELDRIAEWNDTRAPFPEGKTLDGIFAEACAAWPQATAATFAAASPQGRKRLTYGGLKARVDALAARLSGLGVRPGSIVAVMAERSAELLVALLAIMRSGGAYLPMDPAYPLHRKRFLIADSGAHCLLTQGKLPDFPDPGCPAFDLDMEVWEYPLREAHGGPCHGPGDLAYVIYTSGSTGNPKGALVEHRSIVNRLHWMQSAYPISARDVILQKTPVTFDVSVWELFWWFLAGAAVHFPVSGDEKDPAAIAKAIREIDVTVIHFVPPMLRIFLEYLEYNGGRASVPSLKRVFCSGDALQAATVRAFHRVFGQDGPSLHNLYGPTEAAVDVTYFDCPPGHGDVAVPIGKPINNTKIHILGKDGKPRPVGLPGELFISGTGVGRGYLRQPALTGVRFLADPFHPGERMYRTGDLAAWNSEGQIEFLGRMDFQIKIRGFRVEPGEIERRMAQYPGVEEALVIARAEADGDMRLCGYFISNAPIEAHEMKNHLLAALPEYMVPAHLIRIAAMPLTANGKADRRALPLPVPQAEATVPNGSESGFAERLLPLARDVLNRSTLGIDDDFFEMGGHSLKAASFALRIQKHFGLKVGLTQVFQARTLRRLAAVLGSASRPAAASPELVRVPDAAFHQASPAQTQIFLACKMEGDGVSQNLPVALRVEGKIDEERFATALRAVVSRHEPLRTSFAMEGGRPVQIISADPEPELERLERPGASLEGLLEAFVRPIRLDRAPLMRTCLAQTEPSRYWVLFDFHHIISDGISMGVFIADFLGAYAGVTPRELPLRFRDYSEWLNGSLASGAFADKRDYWLKKLAGPLPVLDLNTDFPRPQEIASAGASCRFFADAEETRAIRAAASAHGTTLYAFLLAGYASLLAAQGGMEELIVAIPMGARPHIDLENLVGMFVNTAVLRAFPGPEKSFREFLAEVSADALEAAERQEFPLESLLGSLRISREAGRTPLYETLFVLQNMSMPAMELDGLKITRRECDSIASRLDLSLLASEEGEVLAFHFEYRTALFGKSSMEALAREYLRMLAAAARNPESKLRELAGDVPEDACSQSPEDIEFSL